MGSETVSPLRKARLAKGWRLIDLAQSAGLSPSLVSMVENGYVPSAGTRAKLARAVELPLGDLWPVDEAAEVG